MEERKALIFAGIMGRTNMGQAMPDRRKIREARYARNLCRWTLDTAVMHFCQEFMESEEHQTIFMEECGGWYETLKPMSDEEFKKKWPAHHKAWVFAEPRRFGEACMIQKGAVNPCGISKSLNDACKEVVDEGGNQREDPAVRLIVHQLAYLCNTSGFDKSLSEYRAALDECEKHLTEAEKRVYG